MKALLLLAVLMLTGCAKHGEPIGGGTIGEGKAIYADADGWYCYDDRGNKWPSNGECD